ncbi:hypothetical protein PV10_08986 [Exophiala mesophila]|uniref:RING-type E3 ubiquitin transferase n=1 Tax=Exophiala mesophila TaxID=212818 RepID=A0A0D1XIS5_EXOME|nr:uncharacterized protein PV10_08986 [Exophiala mesophila]KIV88056.1 hypothetical protein PV10_08986 [Exophiala mesophila]
MRPLRFLLLLFFFVAIPIALTCWSLVTAVESVADSFHPGYKTRSSRLKALFSFSTPSSLFPPSAVISLTYDNSTFFLARPAAFGPSLPSNGLSGELWVGKGFGDDALAKEQDIHIVGWELGCSDVPGWSDFSQTHLQPLKSDQSKNKAKIPRGVHAEDNINSVSSLDPDTSLQDQPTDDGTDDHLHRPLEDSNPATPAKPGEPANANQADKNKKSTHADIESLQESADISGKIVMLARGGCGFLEKVKWAQRRGGIALIVGDNEKGGQLTIMYAKGDTSNVTIPALFTSYTSAHLLASLVPPEKRSGKVGLMAEDKTLQPSNNLGKSSHQKPEDSRPVFTTTRSGPKKPTSTPTDMSVDGGWLDGILSALGVNDESRFANQEDSRRPPSSGNIDWVLLEDWDDDKPAKLDETLLVATATNAQAQPTPPSKAKATPIQKPGGDDFVIGVQDWRDADLIAPKSNGDDTAAIGQVKNRKGAKPNSLDSAKPTDTPPSALKGGSITPGSGEYNHDSPNQGAQKPRKGPHPDTIQDQQDVPGKGKAKSSPWREIFSSSESVLEGGSTGVAGRKPDHRAAQRQSFPDQTSSGEEQEGLWVTLTPTSVSTSPFFDTLLVLVVSPLITLTVVYALLLLRSRIRRRRWRAPKSVVERLPVRTYHTMATTSSTTSSQVTSPVRPSVTSPLLVSATQDVSRRPSSLARTRSQTTTGIFPSSNVGHPSSSATPRASPIEKPSKSSRRKRYTGRQVECVVCLEEYIDGESQVMSLPCGHEFHVDCITPWLVTRRRTCPICKGDVVRSMAGNGNSSRSEDDHESTEDEQTGDNFQNQVAQTANDDPSAAIPIPIRNDEETLNQDVERVAADDQDALLEIRARQSELGMEQQPQTLWGRMLSSSMRGLSGDTLWRQTPVDRNR